MAKLGTFRGWMGALAFVWLAGCASSRLSDADARLKQVTEEGQALTAAAQKLEDRLLADQANLHLWQELARRHQHVSAIAVANHSEHVASMARYMEQQELKAERLNKGGGDRLEMAYSKALLRAHARGHEGRD